MANCTVGACVVATVDALAVVGFTVVGAVDGFTVVACVEAGLVGFVAAASVGSLAAVSAVAIFVILGLTRLLYAVSEVDTAGALFCGVGAEKNFLCLRCES